MRRRRRNRRRESNHATVLVNRSNSRIWMFFSTITVSWYFKVRAVSHGLVMGLYHYDPSASLKGLQSNSSESWAGHRSLSL
jgi:hypothetical protein